MDGRERGTRGRPRRSRGELASNPPTTALSSFQRTLESRSACPLVATSELDPSVRWDDEAGWLGVPPIVIELLEAARSEVEASQPQIPTTAPSSFQRTLESRSACPLVATSELDPSVRWDDEAGR